MAGVWPRLLCAFAFSVFGAGNAAAQETVTLSGAPAARIALPILIQTGQYEEAQAVFDSLTREEASLPDLQMLQADLFRATKRPFDAIRIYQALLSGAAAPATVRLALAQTYFELGDEAAAEHHFRLALSGEPAPEAARIAESYLQQIARRNRWRLRVMLGASPSSNVNYGTNARQVEIFGLPFSINDDARRTSGVVAELSASAERTFRWSNDWGVRAGVYTTYSNVIDGDRDVAIADGRAGPQFNLGRKTLSTQAAWQQAWYADKVWYGGPGVVLEYDAPAGVDKLYQFAAAARALTYPGRSGRDAANTTALLQRTHYLSPQKFWRLGVRGVENNARDSAESYGEGGLFVDYYQTLPLDLAVLVGVSATFRSFDAADPAFSKKRHDQTVTAAIRLAKRSWNIRGFSPYIGGQVTQAESTIALHAFDQARLDFGLSREF